MDGLTESRIEFGQWLHEAEKAGLHFWAYKELVHDNPDGAKSAWESGMAAAEYIKEEGLDLDLAKYGPAWRSW